MQAIQTLGDAVAWLPTDESTIGLQNFREATIRSPDPHAVGAADTRIIDLLQSADEFGCLVNTVPTVGLEKSLVDGVRDGRLHTTHVITADELALLCQDAERVSRWETYIAAGANVFCYTGRIPCNLIIIDETVIIGDRQLEKVEFIEIQNERTDRGATT